MRKIKMFIGKHLWFTAERFHIDLGNFAPICFGWMVGSKGTRIK